MIEDNLKHLGRTIADLRVSHGLQQSELAYEAGISERTLQRLEAGEIVKDDGLIKILNYLGVFEDIIKLISPAKISPSALAKQMKNPSSKRALQERLNTSENSGSYKKRRVRTKPVSRKEKSNIIEEGVNWVWPEDQK